MKHKDEILDCLKKEFNLRKDFFKQSELIDTIYFGGGTPSVLSANEINGLLEELAIIYNLECVKEITLECNPDDLTLEKLKELSATSINRLSIGIQSFRDEDLIGMNRAHNAKEALRCVQWAKDAGFDNITIDLIYGLPNMDMAAWQNNLDIAEKLDVPHISCYALTIEKRTALHHFIAKGLVQAPNDEMIISQFEQLMKWAEDRNLDHYEISNFAKKGHLAIHNTNYWKDKSYIGFGPSAHSYDGQNRSWNIANNAKYIQSLNEDKLPQMEEQLTNSDRFNEYMLTGLRTKWGIERDRLESFGKGAIMQVNEQIQTYIKSGHVEMTTSGWLLTRSGKYIADRISSDMFMVD